MANTDEISPGNPSSKGFWQWVSVVGIGTILLPAGFYAAKQMIFTNQEFIQTKLINVLEKNSEASSANAATNNAVKDVLEDVKDELEDFNRVTEEQGKRIDRMMQRAWQEARTEYEE